MLEIDSKLLDISMELDAGKMFSPVNAEEERAKVFDNPEYNPVFRYEIAQGIESLYGYMDSIGIGSIERESNGAFGCLSREEREWLVKKYEDKVLIIKAIVNSAVGARDGDPELFEMNERFIHGVPGKETLEYSNGKIQEIIREGIERRPETGMTSEETVDFARAVLDGYGIKEWKVLLDAGLSANANISGIRREYRIKPGRAFPSRFRAILEHHEISHVLRCENGWQQPSILFALSMPNYPFSDGGMPFLEEALAMENEERAAGMDRSRLFVYCLRALAVGQAGRDGFSQVYNAMRDYIGRAYQLDIEDGFVKLNSWKIAKRAKEGLTDTRRPGGRKYIHSYIAGRLVLERHKRSGGDLRELYVGRIGIDDLPHIRSMLCSGFLMPAKYLPSGLQ